MLSISHWGLFPYDQSRADKLFMFIDRNNLLVID